jgi:hypothetical protein
VLISIADWIRANSLKQLAIKCMVVVGSIAVAAYGGINYGPEAVAWTVAGVAAMLLVWGYTEDFTRASGKGDDAI